MGWLRRVTPEKVALELTAAGAPPEIADGIVHTLLGVGLSVEEAHDWLMHDERAYPHDFPMEMAGQVITLKAGSRSMIAQGEAEKVLAAAREFAAASPDERAIARLFGGNVAGARRLTGSDAERTTVIAAIARSIEARVGKPENVCYVGQTRLPGRGDRRIVDRLLDGEEQDVRDELASGEIDPRALLRGEDLIFIGW